MYYLRLFLLHTFFLPGLPALAGATRTAGEQHQTALTRTLAPTKVCLQAKATPLAEIISDLVRQSRIPLSLACEPADLGERPVTLDTGETSFWEALDALCRQAKIHLQPKARSVAPVVNSEAKRTVRQECSLVLQDGVLPEQPVAYLGCARIRLLPAPSCDAKNDRDGRQWLVEVLNEPKLQWRGPLFLSWDIPCGIDGKPVGAAPVVVEDNGKDKKNRDGSTVKVMNVIKIIPGGLMRNCSPSTPGFDPAFLNQLNQDKIATVLREEIPVSWVPPAEAAGRSLTWQGKLQGEFLLPPVAVVSVAEMTKADGKRIEGKDGSGLTVKKVDRKVDGKVQLEVEIEESPLQAGRVDQGVRIIKQVVVDWLGDSGSQSITGKELGIFAWDTKGRKYGIVATRLSANDHACIYRLVLKPPVKGSVPAKLERHASYPVKFEQTFTLHDVHPR